MPILATLGLWRRRRVGVCVWVCVCVCACIYTYIYKYTHVYICVLAAHSGAAGGSMSVPRQWLSSQHPRLAIILTILRRLRTSLTGVRGPRPGASARKRLAKGEAKQAKDEEIDDDDEDD